MRGAVVGLGMVVLVAISTRAAAAHHWGGGTQSAAQNGQPPAAEQPPVPGQPPRQPPPAGQPPTPGQPLTPEQPPRPGAQPAAPVSRVFGSDLGLLFNAIKPDRTGDFEAVVAKIKEGLSASSDPVRRQQAASWRVFKMLEPGPGGSVLYVFLMDPPVKGADYTISKILAEAFPTDAPQLLARYQESYLGGASVANLQLVSSFVQQ